MGIDGLPGNVRAPGAGRRGARAHLCAALTLTVADPFLPGRRVDTSAPRDLFLSCSFMGKNNEQTSMVGRATGALGPPSSDAPAAFRERLERILRLLRRASDARLRRSPPASRVPGHPSRPRKRPNNVSHALREISRVRLAGRPFGRPTVKREICAGAVVVGRAHGNARPHRGCDTLRDVADPLASVARAAGD